MWYEEFVKRMPFEEGNPTISEICEKLKKEYGAVELPEERIPSLKWVHRFNACTSGLSNSPNQPGMPAARKTARMIRCTLPLRNRWDISIRTVTSCF